MPLVTQTATALARSIDHTLLKPEATSDQIVQLCNEARRLQVFSVCVASSYVSLAVRQLQGSGVRVAAVVGFPLGHQATEIKAREAAFCVEHGADEIDMVLAIGAIKSRDLASATDDIQAVVHAAQGHVVKVILETHLLSADEKLMAVQAAQKGGAQFLKTSTGFTGGGATIEDIRWMRAQVDRSMQIKASGGIRDYATAVAMLEAGADRLGTSQTLAILGGATTPAPEGAY